MLISVIINCFNGSNFLARAIDSVLAQRFERFELIVFDNCSTDGSAKIVKSYKDSKVRLVSSSQLNVIPLYAARNKAVDHARGEVICFLDCDDFMLPGRLSLIADTFSDASVHWMCTTYLKYVEQNRDFSQHKQKCVYGHIDVTALISDYNIGILTCAYRKEIFTTLRFSEKFNIIGDYVFNILCAAYYRGVFVDIATAIYIEHGQNISVTQKDCWSVELTLLTELLLLVRGAECSPNWLQRFARRSKILACYLESVGTTNISVQLVSTLSLLLLYSPAMFGRALVVRCVPSNMLNKLRNLLRSV